MNVIEIFNTLRKLPIKPKHIKMIYDTYQSFKGEGFKGTETEIDTVLNRIGMKRQDLSQLLPYLDKPHIANTLERVMPHSVGNLKSLAGYLINNSNNNNINNDYNNNYNNNINNNNNNHNNNGFRYPKI